MATKCDTMEDKPSTRSSLYPLYRVEGHGAHWRPVMEDARLVYSKGDRYHDSLPERVIITRHVFSEQRYKSEAERYIEIIRMLRQLPGGSPICDDVFERIPITTEETITLN